MAVGFDARQAEELALEDGRRLGKGQFNVVLFAAPLDANAEGVAIGHVVVVKEWQKCKKNKEASRLFHSNFRPNFWHVILA